MRKFTQEEEEFFARAAEEAAEWDEKYGTLTEEEFWEDIRKFDEKLRRKKKLRKSVKLHIPNALVKISKRFVRT